MLVRKGDLIAVTGATGFIGRRLVSSLVQLGVGVAAIVRRPQDGAFFPPGTMQRIVSRLDDPAELKVALAGVDGVVHLADDAARGGQQPEHASGPADRMKALCIAMEEIGVQRLLYSSSVYARMCEEGNWTRYGQEKLEAERVAQSFSHLEPVILRFSPVYGLGCGGGFAAIVSLVKRGLPLPFGSFHNPRDYLAIENLLQLVGRVLACDEDRWKVMNGKVFEASDGKPIALATLIPMIGKAMGRQARIFPFPTKIIRLLARHVGMADSIEAGYASLIARDIEVLHETIGWTPSARMPSTLHYLRDS